MLTRTPFGNWIYATGGNIVAARGAGVPTSLVKVVLFVVTALAATLVGVIQAVEFHSGNAANGQGYVFQAPIAAVIGGVLLGGGYGSPLGIFFGSVIYGVISVGIFYTGWNTDWLLADPRRAAARRGARQQLFPPSRAERAIGFAPLPVIARSVATKQSRRRMDCFASLAMTARGAGPMRRWPCPPARLSSN